MIYVTGDTHSDFKRLSTRVFPEQKKMTKDDYVIILGDFVGIWSRDPEDRSENYMLKWLEDKNFTLLFVDGNHENYDRLNAFPVREWKGGKVHEIRPSILHLMRGQVYRIEGKTVFVFGGAQSHDIEDGVFELEDPELHRLLKLGKRGYPEYQDLRFRVNHVSWWKEELPSDEEMDEGIRNLEAADWKTDFILTHCLPTSLHTSASEGEYEPDILTDYLELIREKCLYRYWFCGHYHWDHSMSDREKILYSSCIGGQRGFFMAYKVSKCYNPHMGIADRSPGF